MSAYDDLLRAKATLSRHDGFRDSTGDYHPSLRESIHDELADALAGRWLSYGEDHQVDDLVEHPDRDGARITATHARLLVDALLPLVEARVLAAANRHARVVALYQRREADLTAERDQLAVRLAAALAQHASGRAEE